MKFYSSVRIEVRKTENLKNGNEQYGSRVKAKVVKNKIAPPFKIAEFDILYGHGISKSGELVDIGVELDIVEKSGSWFAYEGNRIGQGKDNARKYLEQNPDIARAIEQRIRDNRDKLDNLMISDEYSEGDDDAELSLPE